MNQIMKNSNFHLYREDDKIYLIRCINIVDLLT